MGQIHGSGWVRWTLVALLGLADCTGGALEGIDGAAEGDGSQRLDALPRADGLAADAVVEGITSFVLHAADNHGLTADATGTIQGNTIAVTVPYGTSVTALVPTITFTGIGVEPASATAESFASPVTYTVTVENGGTLVYTATVTVAPDCTPMPGVCSTAVYDRAHAYALANPTHNGGTWNQWCAALAYRFSNRAGPAQPYAITAYHNSHIVSGNASEAEVGAFHYWAIGADGHVGVDLLGGGTSVFMASNHITTVWGTSIGTNSVAGYSASAGATYLGWSMDYAGSTVTGGGGAACTTGAPFPATCALPHTGTATSGVPDGIFWMLMQRYAADHGYTGPINGSMDVPSWEGIQTAMRAYQYVGPINGIPRSQHLHGDAAPRCHVRVRRAPQWHPGAELVSRSLGVPRRTLRAIETHLATDAP